MSQQYTKHKNAIAASNKKSSLRIQFKIPNKSTGKKKGYYGRIPGCYNKKTLVNHEQELTDQLEGDFSALNKDNINPRRTAAFVFGPGNIEWGGWVSVDRDEYNNINNRNKLMLDLSKNSLNVPETWERPRGTTNNPDVEDLPSSKPADRCDEKLKCLGYSPSTFGKTAQMRALSNTTEGQLMKRLSWQGDVYNYRGRESYRVCGKCLRNGTDTDPSTFRCVPIATYAVVWDDEKLESEGVFRSGFKIARLCLHDGDCEKNALTSDESACADVQQPNWLISNAPPQMHPFQINQSLLVGKCFDPFMKKLNNVKMPNGPGIPGKKIDFGGLHTVDDRRQIELPAKEEDGIYNSKRGCDNGSLDHTHMMFKLLVTIAMKLNCSREFTSDIGETEKLWPPNYATMDNKEAHLSLTRDVLIFGGHRNSERQKIVHQPAHMDTSETFGAKSLDDNNSFKNLVMPGSYMIALGNSGRRIYVNSPDLTGNIYSMTPGWLHYWPGTLVHGGMTEELVRDRNGRIDFRPALHGHIDSSKHPVVKDSVAVVMEGKHYMTDEQMRQMESSNRDKCWRESLGLLKRLLAAEPNNGAKKRKANDLLTAGQKVIKDVGRKKKKQNQKLKKDSSVRGKGTISVGPEEEDDSYDSDDSDYVED